MAQKRPQSLQNLVANDAGLFNTTIKVIETHRDRNFPDLCFAIGYLIATDRPVRTVENGPLKTGDLVVVSVGKPFNPHQDNGAAQSRPEGENCLTQQVQYHQLVRFSSCELLNDDEIEACSYQVLHS